MSQENLPRVDNYVPEGPKTKLESLVTEEDLRRMFDYFAKNVYRAGNRDPVAIESLGIAIELMRHDYTLFTISNQNGELCNHYPTEIVILEYQNTLGNDTIYENLYDGAQLKEKINNSRIARCRTRFPVPVILYKGKYILRSSTLSGGPEIIGRTGLSYFLTSWAGPETSETDDNNDMQIFDKVRNRDIDLLSTYNVQIIVDLMVEKKKVKYGFNVSSSEKVDKENRYGNFNLLSLPYPGCEFFTHFHRENYEAGSLHFDWSQSFVDAEITPPSDPCIKQLGINWEEYKSWDLITMTKNYLKVILKYLEDRDSGILIHCISGWDRTPLYVSLVRMSLWADGLIHQHLSPQQMLYLTVAYDWMLFGHNLYDRTQKSEDILFFCFYMLKFISGDDFCFNQQKRKRLSSERSDRSANRANRNDQQEPLMFEPDPNGSNVSLNSNSSSGSEKSQDPSQDSQHEPLSPPHAHVEMASSPSPSVHSLSDDYIHVSSPDVAGAMRSPSARRTSPQPIPRTARLRNDSVTSTGSWQMISGTGSLNGSDSSTNGNNSDSSNPPDNGNSKNGNPENGNSDKSEETRASKLYAIRRQMFSLYSSVIGMKYVGT